MGCILGGAVGDAFGYPIEFDSLENIRETHGPDLLVEPALDGGAMVVSDDTQMVLFSIEGLRDAVRESKEPEEAELLEAIHDAYRRWALTQGEGMR